MELQGLPEGGKRARVRNLLPRYADKVKTMTAILPVAITTTFGETVGGDTAGGVPEPGIRAMGDILVGAKNLVTLAAYVAESRPFEDGDIPQETFERAVTAIGEVLADGPQDVVRKASAERCRRLLASAVDYDEMKSFASSQVCNNI